MDLWFFKTILSELLYWTALSIQHSAGKYFAMLQTSSMWNILARTFLLGGLGWRIVLLGLPSQVFHVEDLAGEA